MHTTYFNLLYLDFLIKIAASGGDSWARDDRVEHADGSNLIINLTCR